MGILEKIKSLFISKKIEIKKKPETPTKMIARLDFFSYEEVGEILEGIRNRTGMGHICYVESNNTSIPLYAKMENISQIETLFKRADRGEIFILKGIKSEG